MPIMLKDRYSRLRANRIVPSLQIRVIAEPVRIDNVVWNYCWAGSCQKTYWLERTDLRSRIY